MCNRERRLLGGRSGSCPELLNQVSDFAEPPLELQVCRLNALERGTRSMLVPPEKCGFDDLTSRMRSGVD